MGRGARSWTSDALTAADNHQGDGDMDRRTFGGFDGGDGGKLASVTYRFRADHVQGKQRRAGARSFCRWIELVGGDSAVTGCGAQRDLRAKPPDDASGRR